MCYCKISDASGGIVFKNIVETLSSQMSSMSLCILTDTVEISGVDMTHVSVVSISLFSSCFSTFHKLEPDRPIHIHISLEQLKKILRACNNDDVLSIIVENKGDNTVIFQFENNLRCHAFTLTMLDIEEDSIDVPELEYNTVVQLPANGFRHLIDELCVMDSEAVQFVSTTEDLTLTTNDVACNSSVILKNSSQDIIISWKDDVSVKISLPKIKSYSVLSKLCSSVQVHISEDFPALLYYKFVREIETDEKGKKEMQIIGEGRCHIAPMID